MELDVHRTVVSKDSDSYLVKAYRIAKQEEWLLQVEG